MNTASLFYILSTLRDLPSTAEFTTVLEQERTFDTLRRLAGAVDQNQLRDLCLLEDTRSLAELYATLPWVRATLRDVLAGYVLDRPRDLDMKWVLLQDERDDGYPEYHPLQHAITRNGKISVLCLGPNGNLEELPTTEVKTPSQMLATLEYIDRTMRSHDGTVLIDVVRQDYYPRYAPYAGRHPALRHLLREDDRTWTVADLCTAITHVRDKGGEIEPLWSLPYETR